MNKRNALHRNRSVKGVCRKLITPYGLRKVKAVLKVSGLISIAAERGRKPASVVTAEIVGSYRMGIITILQKTILTFWTNTSTIELMR